MASLNIPFSVKVLNPLPVDIYYGPYVDVAAAKAAVPLAVRYDGLTVQITGTGEYHWLQADLTDDGLVAKGGGGADELTADELAAVQGANSPDASNVFATMTDVPDVSGYGDIVTHDVDEFQVAIATTQGNVLQDQGAGLVATSILQDLAGTPTVDLNSRRLLDASGNNVIDYTAIQLKDPAEVVSVDWQARKLYKSDGTTVAFDWENDVIPDGANYVPLAGTDALLGKIDEDTDLSGTYTNLSHVNKGYVDSKTEAGDTSTWVINPVADGTGITAVTTNNGTYSRVGTIVTCMFTLEVTYNFNAIGGAAIGTIEFDLPIASTAPIINGGAWLRNFELEHIGFSITDGGGKGSIRCHNTGGVIAAGNQITVSCQYSVN